MHSVSITTKVLCSNPDHDEVYSIWYYVIKFVSDLRQVSDFLRVFLFPPPIKLKICCLIKSPKQRLETYCFCSVSYYYYYYYYSSSCSCYSPFFPCTMNLSTADLRNCRTEFHETWWSYRYMFLVDPKVFRFVVKGVKAIFLGVQRGWGLL